MLPGNVCGDVIQREREMWKCEEPWTAPITLLPLDERTLTKLRHLLLGRTGHAGVPDSLAPALAIPARYLNYDGLGNILRIR